MEILFLCLVPFIAAFGAAAIMLCFMEPRKIAFIFTACAFLALGMKRSPMAKKTLQWIKD